MVKFYALEELCTDIIDCPHSTPQWLEKGIPIIRNFNISNGQLDLSKPSFVDEKTYKERTKRAQPEAGDLLISREAPMGEVCMIPEGFKCCLGQRLVLLKVDKKVCDSQYLLYALLSKYVQKQIKRIDQTGSIVSNLNISDLKKLIIPIVSDNQTIIGNTLSIFNEKIQNNNRLNKELESMAKTIYDYWFLQFDFPDENGKPYKSSGGKMVWNEELKREIPVGWDIESLKDVLVKSNATIMPLEAKKYPYTPMDSLPCNKMSFGNYKSGEEANSSLLLYHKYAILFGSMRAYFHRVCIAPFDGVTRTTTFVLYPKNKDWLGYAFETLNLKSTVNYAVTNSIGTQQPYAVWEDNLDSLKIPKVPDKLKIKYSNIVKKIIVTVIHNENESKELSVLKDFLLPLLMNGQVGFKEE